MNTLGHKMVALAVIFTIIFFMTALPIKIASFFYRQGKRGLVILSAIMCFGGGVFFGTYLLHITPEVVEKVDASIKSNYPFAYLIIGGGFFMMMFLEKAVVELQKYKDRKRKEKEAALNPSSDVVMVSVRHNHDELPPGEKGPAYDNVTYIKTQDNVNVAIANGVSHPVVLNVIDNPQAASNPNPQNPGELQSTLSHLDHFEHHHEGQEVGHSHAQGSAAKSIVLLLALSADSVFEGLSLGLQSSVSGIWNLVIAILSHEIVVAFSLGLQLFKHNSPLRTFFMALIYGIMTPVGIAIGAIVSEGFKNSIPNLDLVQGVLMGITAGVFIYVTFFEILINEISHDATLPNLLAVLVGFGVMAALMVLHHNAEHGGTGGNNSNGTAKFSDENSSYGYPIAKWLDSIFP